VSQYDAYQWEARQRRLALEGRHEELGRLEAERLEAEERARVAERFRSEGVAREYGRLQAEADRVGAGMTRDQLDRINARYQEKLAQMPDGLRGFSTEAAAWLLLAREEAERERGAAADRERAQERPVPPRVDLEDEHTLTDQKIREMTPQRYVEVWDMEANRPREGFVYVPGTSGRLEDVLAANSNSLASGSGSGRVDVQ